MCTPCVMTSTPSAAILCRPGPCAAIPGSEFAEGFRCSAPLQLRSGLSAHADGCPISMADSPQLRRYTRIAADPTPCCNWPLYSSQHRSICLYWQHDPRVNSSAVTLCCSNNDKRCCNSCWCSSAQVLIRMCMPTVCTRPGARQYCTDACGQTSCSLGPECLQEDTFGQSARLNCHAPLRKSHLGAQRSESSNLLTTPLP